MQAGKALGNVADAAAAFPVGLQTASLRSAAGDPCFAIFFFSSLRPGIVAASGSGGAYSLHGGGHATVDRDGIGPATNHERWAFRCSAAAPPPPSLTSNAGQQPSREQSFVSLASSGAGGAACAAPLAATSRRARSSRMVHALLPIGLSSV